MRSSTPLTVALVVGLLAFAAGCGEDVTTEEDVPTATISDDAGSTATAAAPTPAAQGIREEELAASPGVEQFLSTVGGEPELVDIIYADLTSDGIEEAVAHVPSGGTLGNLAVFVFGYVNGELRQLLLEPAPEEALSGHLQAAVEEEKLSVAWPVYLTGDANCCPTGGARTRFYRWDGSALVAEGDVTTPPGGELP